jgi:hypothetical protein
MNIHGFIVGIEKYDQPTWNVDGPVTNAIEMAKWLASVKTPPKHIHLFLSTKDQKDKRIAPLRKAGYDVRLAADWGTIDTFWRSELRRDIPAKARLFSFWSGHGFTSKRRNRIFFCRDYMSDAFRNRVFNATEYLHTLLTKEFSCFTDQIMLADVCGVYDDIQVQDIPPEVAMEERSQLGFFATPEGKYAGGKNGLGEFTKTVLEVLNKQEGWPEQKSFAEAVEKAFENAQIAPFRVSGFRGAREYQEGPVGGTPSSGNKPIDDLFVLLREQDVTEEVFKPHYLRTVNDLGNPELAKAQGLMGPLKALASLLDERLPNQLTHGLLQFVLRLSDEPALKEALTEWLAVNAAGQSNTVASIRAKLDAEARQRILVVVVEVDSNERVSAFKAYLCNSDASLVRGWKFERRTLSGWEAFTRQLQELLAEFVKDGELANIQVHFAVDAPLFDRAFHKIPLAPGKHAIGDDAVVVVRYRGRLVSNDDESKRIWCDYAKELREEKTKKLKWLRLSLTKEIPSEQGLFLATFALPEPATEQPSSANEKKVIRRLLKLGAPYVYLPHAAAAKDDWKSVATALRKMLSENSTLVDFPSALKAARLRNSVVGAEGSMIWDDPLAIPVGLTEGVTYG